MTAVSLLRNRPDTRLFYDNFRDPAGTRPARRDVRHRMVGAYEFGAIPTKWRALAGQWATDGSGYVYPTSVEGDTQNMLHAALVAPAGTSGDRKITSVHGMNAGNRPGIIVATDGRYVILWEWFGFGGNTFRIREGDMQAFSPTYNTTPGNALNTLATSGAVPGWVNTAHDEEWVAELIGTQLTVTHVGSGTSLVATVTVPIGPEFGILSNNALAKTKSVLVEAVGSATFYDLGNGVRLVDERVVGYMGDPDGISLADRDGAGLPDILLGNSSNQNATIGGVYLFNQDAPDSFETEIIDTNSSFSVTDRYTGVEGVCFVPLRNDRYAFVHDTPASGQYLIDLETRSRLQLSSHTNGQDCRILTIDGELCIVATHEGAGGGSTIANGGVVGYRYLGDPALVDLDPMLLTSWQEFTIVRRPGAWALQKSNFGFVDLAGDGVPDQIAFGARDGGANTSVTAPGFYSVQKPGSPFTTEWTETAHYVAADGTDFINWDFGDFSGDGNELDVLFSVLNEQAAPKYLRKSTGWTVTSTLTLGLSATNKLYNVMKMPVRGTGSRDGYLAWVAFQGFIHVYWDGSAWASKMLLGERNDHGWNACNGAIWDRGDGTISVFVGDSFGNALRDLRFR